MNPATPCLVVDAETVRRNIERMQQYVDEHGLTLRPHTKTHKSLRVAGMQVQRGAVGVTVAKANEARVMAAATIHLLMAYPPVTEPRCRLLAEIAHEADLIVGVDSVLAAEGLARAAGRVGARIGVLVDIDIGYGRTGVQSDHAAIELARAMNQWSALELRGMMLYTGHIAGEAAEQVPQMEALQRRLAGLIAHWDRDGLSRELISSGSTPSARFSHHAPAVNEIRPGTYVYNDMNIVRGGYDSIENCAARIHATVISSNVAGEVVIDAGSKTLTSDLCGPAPDTGFGYLVEYPEAKIYRLTEEHGQVDVAHCDRPPRLGERVIIIPNHICVCVNMQNSVWWQEPDSEPESIPVDTRGMLV